MKLHTGVREHECKECGKAFFEKRDLKVHEQKMHKIGDWRKHECQECGMGFVEKRDLRHHMNSTHHMKNNQEDALKLSLFPTFQ